MLKKYVPLGTELYSHCLVPWKGFKAIGPLVAHLLSSWPGKINTAINYKINYKVTRKIRLRAVDWYASALSHTALLPKSLI